MNWNIKNKNLFQASAFIRTEFLNNCKILNSQGVIIRTVKNPKKNKGGIGKLLIIPHQVTVSNVVLENFQTQKINFGKNLLGVYIQCILSLKKFYNSSLV